MGFHLPNAGCANDYIYLDCRTAGVPENIAALSTVPAAFSIGSGQHHLCICAPRTRRSGCRDAYLQRRRQRGRDVRQRHPLH